MASSCTIQTHTCTHTHMHTHAHRHHTQSLKLLWPFMFLCVFPHSLRQGRTRNAFFPPLMYVYVFQLFWFFFSLFSFGCDFLIVVGVEEYRWKDRTSAVKCQKDPFDNNINVLNYLLKQRLVRRGEC